MKLSVDNLACRRSGRLIFDRLSFAVAAGEALLVTGRNGAGKSSLLAILAGRLRQDSGTIAFEGAGERSLPECLHLVGHREGLKSALTARENLVFAQDLLGSPALPATEALDAVRLGHAATLPVAYLSAGQRRRVALARLLVAHRPLWLLDEPTAALDATSQEILAGLMTRHLTGGGLIIAATHQPIGIGAREIRIERRQAGLPEEDETAPAVIPSEPQARERDPSPEGARDWIPFPSASLRPGMTEEDGSPTAPPPGKSDE